MRRGRDAVPGRLPPISFARFGTVWGSAIGVSTHSPKKTQLISETAPGTLRAGFGASNPAESQIGRMELARCCAF